MNTTLIILAQGIEKSKSYQFGYEIGYFVGSHFWEVVITFVLIVAVLLYLSFFRKKKATG